MSKQRLVPLNVFAAASAPAGGRVGDLYYNTTDSKLYVWDGTEWIVSSGGSGGGVPGLSTHSADTTDVHGIADTSALETQTGAQSKATAAETAAKAYADGLAVNYDAAGSAAAAQTAAQSYADTAVSTHSADTTGVHGITDTANLVYTDDARLSDTRTPTDNTVSTAKIVDGAVTSAKIADGTIVNGDVSASAGIAQSKISGLVTDLASKETPAGAQAKADAAEAAAEATAAAALSSHEADTTNVHGIADTSLLATKAYADNAATTAAAAVVDAAPATLDTLNELAAALGDDPNFATTVTNSIALKAPIASPTFTGTPAAPTAAADTNTTQLATTAYVVGQGYLKSTTASSAYAPLASPAFTGTPSAPTAASGTNTTQIATTAFVTAAVSTISINAQTGTSYTLALSDLGKIVEMNNAAANTLNVPTDAAVAFPVGTAIDIFQTGTGQTTVAGSGVTINARPGLKLSGQWATATLVKRAANTWILIGNITA